jgi:hypothetical protein
MTGVLLGRGGWKAFEDNLFKLPEEILCIIEGHLMEDDSWTELEARQELEMLMPAVPTWEQMGAEIRTQLHGSGCGSRLYVDEDDIEEMDWVHEQHMEMHRLYVEPARAREQAALAARSAREARVADSRKCRRAAKATAKALCSAPEPKGKGGKGKQPSGGKGARAQEASGMCAYGDRCASAGEY